MTQQEKQFDESIENILVLNFRRVIAEYSNERYKSFKKHGVVAEWNSNRMIWAKAAFEKILGFKLSFTEDDMYRVFDLTNRKMDELKTNKKENV